MDRPTHRSGWTDGRTPATADTAAVHDGEWQGRCWGPTKHLKVGLVWRNGVPHSDRATLTEYYVRHGNILTVTMILEDPVYWEEPFIRNASFELDSGTRVLPEPCEPQVEIPRAVGEVPHYLPGANPYLREVADMYKLPLEAVRGGAATTYPEYAKRLRATYAPPEKCPVYCCGGTGQATQNDNKASCRVETPPAPAPVGRLVQFTFNNCDFVLVRAECEVKRPYPTRGPRDLTPGEFSSPVIPQVGDGRRTRTRRADSSRHVSTGSRRPTPQAETGPCRRANRHTGTPAFIERSSSLS